MIWIGCDPGARGAWAVISETETGRFVKAYPWDDTFFVSDMQALSHTGKNIVAAVEKVGARPGQGTVSMFNFGKSAGYIDGVLSALGIPYQLVPPTKWKKEFSLIGKDKKASIETCRKLFPDLNLLPTPQCRVPSDGLAEATLLALYAARNFSKG